MDGRSQAEELPDGGQPAVYGSLHRRSAENGVLREDLAQRVEMLIVAHASMPVASWAAAATISEVIRQFLFS
jgi:hypothetical protein